MAGEQLGEDPGHRPPVLDDVGDARRGAEVVLQHAEVAVGVADQVDAGHVDPHPVGRLDAGRRPVEVVQLVTSRRGTMPVVEDLARAVDVGQERLEGPDPLGHARLR